MSLIYEDKSKLIPENCFLFSVTDINLYLYNPTDFFKKVLLKQQTDSPSFNSLLGTCIHHLCSSYITNTKDLSEIHNEIAEFIEGLNPLEYDKSLLYSKYKDMQEVVIGTIRQNEFNFGSPLGIEESFIEKITDRVYLGGTLDIRFSNMIMDYKTTTNKYIKPDSEFPERYSNQLYAYAWLCKKKGIKIENLVLQYFTQPEINRYSEITMKPLKDYPCKDVIVIQSLQEEYLKNIENIILVIGETIEYILNHKDSFKYFVRDLNLTLE